MRLTWLGWAGVELEHDGATLVIDPLVDPAALYAAVGDAAADVHWPEVVPRSSGTAVGALVTHLHRDHADAGALTVALATDAPVLVPGERSRDDPPAPGLAQATHELSEAGLPLRGIAPWETTTRYPDALRRLRPRPLLPLDTGRPRPLPRRRGPTRSHGRAGGDRRGGLMTRDDGGR